jgi:hypothetical protein
VQVDPIKPKLKPSGTNRLKLNCDILLSPSAFKFYVRHCSKAWDNQLCIVRCPGGARAASEPPCILEVEAGAYTRPLLSST